MLAGACRGLASTLSYHKLRLSKLHTVVSLPGGDGCRPGQREAAAVEQVLKDQGRREDGERETGRSQEKEEGGEGHSVTGRGKLIQIAAVLCWICSLLSLWKYTCPSPPFPPPPPPQPGRSNLMQIVTVSFWICSLLILWNCIPPPPTPTPHPPSTPTHTLGEVILYRLSHVLCYICSLLSSGITSALLPTPHPAPHLGEVIWYRLSSLVYLSHQLFWA